jgi:hypothetical protein
LFNFKELFYCEKLQVGKVLDSDNKRKRFNSNKTIPEQSIKSMLREAFIIKNVRQKVNLFCHINNIKY